MDGCSFRVESWTPQGLELWTPRRFSRVVLDTVEDTVSAMLLNRLRLGMWALNSAVECHLHTVEVIGSNPIAPTISCTTGISGDVMLIV